MGFFSNDSRLPRAIKNAEDLAEAIQLLKGVPTLAGLELAEFERLKPVLAEVVFFDGEDIVRAGEVEPSIYVIAEGHAQLRHTAFPVRGEKRKKRGRVRWRGSFPCSCSVDPVYNKLRS